MGRIENALMHDTHCHIDLYPDPLTIAKATENAQIATIAVTNGPSAYFAAKPHLQKFRYLRLAVGLHPLCAKDHTLQERILFRRAFQETPYIGEVGLDFSRHGAKTKTKQIESFKFVLDLLRQKMKFVTLHSRRAESTILDMLTDYGVGPVVFHWYSGPLTLIESILDSGHFFSFNTAMVGSENGKKIINQIPPHRVLMETDGPFIQFGGHAVVPANVDYVCSYLSTCWDVPTSKVQLILKENLISILKATKTHSSQLSEQGA